MPTQNAPDWLVQARRHMGARHMHGLPALPLRAALWNQFRALVGQPADGCGAMVATCLNRSGFAAPQNWISTAAWCRWGEACDLLLGAVVVTRSGREPRVGLLIGLSPEGDPQVLGMPTGGVIGVTVLKRADVHTCRWPVGAPPGVAAPVI